MKNINVFVAGIKQIHLQKKEDRGIEPGKISFCNENCNDLQLVKLPLTELNLSCPECDKQVQMLKTIK